MRRSSSGAGFKLEDVASGKTYRPLPGGKPQMISQQRSGVGVNDVTQQNGRNWRTSESGFGAEALNNRSAAKPSAVALLQLLSFAYVLGSHRRSIGVCGGKQ
jgi:hypothetical protein